MRLEDRIAAFVALGTFLGEYVSDKRHDIDTRLGNGTCAMFDAAVLRSLNANHWFTRPSIMQSMQAIALNMLQESQLAAWTAAYPQLINLSPKRVGIIMAGNIPLVGFHDLLCVLISGHNAVLKPSSKDRELVEAVCGILLRIAPELETRIQFADRSLNGIDGLIATGSNNSARYFESEYGSIPHLVRKNRFSIAVLSGQESHEQISRLGKDVFDYFGLGCRNVSNILVPEGYDMSILLKSLSQYASVMEHVDYADCYRYQKAVLELSDMPFATNGFIVLREQIPSFSSIALLNYQKYTTFDSVKDLLKLLSDNVQCVISECNELKEALPFGASQTPAVGDYADNIDTVEFLAKL